MQVRAFSLYDTKAGVFHTPFFMAHVGQAVRAAMDLGGDLSTIVGRHPADFALYEIGYFDDATGQLVATAPNALGTVLSLMPAPARQLPQPVGYHPDTPPTPAAGEPAAINGAAGEAR